MYSFLSLGLKSLMACTRIRECEPMTRPIELKIVWPDSGDPSRGMECCYLAARRNRVSVKLMLASSTRELLDVKSVMYDASQVFSVYLSFSWFNPSHSQT